MKRLIISFVTVLISLQIFAQIYIDLKQLKDMGIDINQYPPEQLLSLGLGNCDLNIIKSAIAKGADLNKQIEGAGISSFPLCLVISAAGGVMLPPDYNMIAGTISEGGPEVYSGRSVSDLRRDYLEIVRFFCRKVQKRVFHLILIRTIFLYLLLLRTVILKLLNCFWILRLILISGMIRE